MHTHLILSLVLLSGTDAAEAKRRALEYLAREVPRWSVENKCYSCHNNGDAARALYTAKRLGRAVPDEALRDTTDWLGRPAGWEHNGGEGEFSDKKLAAIQFAFALTTAREAGAVRKRQPLEAAARLLAAEQEPDGSWRIDGSGAIGAPATYGRFLATAVARWVLAAAGDGFRKQTALADRWLRESRPETVLDAAAVLIGTQHEDGSWPETTRPPGGTSYAQRLSTTGWATQALLLTGEIPK